MVPGGGPLGGKYSERSGGPEELWRLSVPTLQVGLLVDGSTLRLYFSVAVFPLSVVLYSWACISDPLYFQHSLFQFLLSVYFSSCLLCGACLLYKAIPSLFTGIYALVLVASPWPMEGGLGVVTARAPRTGRDKLVSEEFGSTANSDLFYVKK